MHPVLLTAVREPLFFCNSSRLTTIMTAGTNGNIFMDFYCEPVNQCVGVFCENHVMLAFAGGTELYPRVFGIDIKQFINCR